MSPDAAGNPTRQDIRRTIYVLERLPDLILDARHERGESVRLVAEAIGTTASNLSLIERGMQEPMMPMTIALLQYLARPNRRRST